MSKQIRFNAFQMNTVSHQSPGLWPHPRDTGHRYTDPDHWTDLARLLEAGLFDAVFLADVLGAYDVYQGSANAALRHAVQAPLNDPLALVPLMAQVTTHLGFGVTCALTYEHPYTFARRISTLDHLTRGRIGWNVVTGYLDSAARNLGLDRQLGHDERAGRSALASFTQADPDRTWTVREAALFIGLGGRGPVLVGDPRQVADQLEAWQDDTGIDGFNLAFAVAHDSMRDVVELIVPELQRRGRYRTAYDGGTLRGQVLGGGARLAPGHVAHAVRL